MTFEICTKKLFDKFRLSLRPISYANLVHKLNVRVNLTVIHVAEHPVYEE